MRRPKEASFFRRLQSRPTRGSATHTLKRALCGVGDMLHRGGTASLLRMAALQSTAPSVSLWRSVGLLLLSLLLLVLPAPSPLLPLPNSIAVVAAALASPPSDGDFPDYYLALEFVDPTTEESPPPAAVPNPSDAEVRQAFKRLALQFHPDKNPSAEAASKFRLLAKARETLLHHAYKRQEYDDLYQQRLLHMEKQWLQQKRTRGGGGKRKNASFNGALTFVASFTPPPVDLGAVMQELETSSIDDYGSSDSLNDNEDHDQPSSPTLSSSRHGDGVPKMPAVHPQDLRDELEVEVEIDDNERDAKKSESSVAAAAAESSESSHLWFNFAEWRLIVWRGDGWILNALSFVLQLACECGASTALVTILIWAVPSIDSKPQGVLVPSFGFCLFAPTLVFVQLGVHWIFAILWACLKLCILEFVSQRQRA